MAKREKNFIDFIKDSQRSKKLTQDFLKCNSQKALKEFFAKNKYSVDPEDLKKILDVKRNLPKVPPWTPEREMAY